MAGIGVSQDRFDKLWSAENEVQQHKAVIRTKKPTTNPFKVMRIPLPKKISTNAHQNLIISHFSTNLIIRLVTIFSHIARPDYKVDGAGCPLYSLYSQLATEK